MKIVKHVPRFLAAALFAASTASAVVVTGATQAGQPTSGLSAAPLAASAAVSIGVGIGGGPRYNRYAYRGGSWVRIGFGFGSPGYAGGYYLGYAAPPIGYYPPVYYGRGYYGPHYYHPYYGRAYYGRGYYGRGYYGRGYGHGYYR